MLIRNKNQYQGGGGGVTGRYVYICNKTNLNDINITIEYSNKQNNNNE